MSRLKTEVSVKWPYESRERELEAIRWYLTGRLDIDTKLDVSLGNAVAAYEYLRHVAGTPAFPNWKQLQKDPEAALELYLKPDIARILLANRFPKAPFYRLSKKTQRQIKFWFSDDRGSAVRCQDIRVLHARGVLGRVCKSV
jgi:hypothetical protein